MLKRIQFFIEEYPIIAKPLKWLKANTYSKYITYTRTKYVGTNGKDFLNQIQKVFEELGISYWLEFGTLLGAVREGDFIGGDSDIDLGAYLDEYSPKIEEVFKKHGFTKVKEIVIDNGEYGRTEAYSYKGIVSDIFYFRRENGKLYGYNFENYKSYGKRKTIDKLGGLVSMEIIFTDTGLKEIDFLGMKFKAPKDTNLHLTEHYGEDFMIPNPNFTEEDVKNITKIDKIGVVKKYDFSKIYIKHED